MAEKKTKKKPHGNTGRPTKGAASVARNYTGEKSKIGQIVYSSFEWFDRKPAQSEEELIERLNEFFSKCCDEDNFPTVEKMALALGVEVETLWKWEHEHRRKGQGFAHHIKRAKTIISAIDAELASKRKIPESTYIFRAKNYYNMTDVQEHRIIAPTDPLGDITDEEVLKQRYQESLPESTGS